MLSLVRAALGKVSSVPWGSAGDQAARAWATIGVAAGVTIPFHLCLMKAHILQAVAVSGG